MVGKPLENQLREIDMFAHDLIKSHKKELARFIGCGDKTLSNHILYCNHAPNGRVLQEKYYDKLFGFAKEKLIELLNGITLSKKEMNYPLMKNTIGKKGFYLLHWKS
jgi:hypothetical protein